MKKKIIIIIGLISIALVGGSVYRQQFYKTKFNVEYYDNSYDVALVTSSYDALNNYFSSYDYNELYLLSGEEFYNKRIGEDTWPTSENLALVNDQIIYENFGSLITYTDGEIEDNNIEPTDVYVANYLDKYITEDDKIIFNQIDNLKIYDPTNNASISYLINDYLHQIIGYDVDTEQIKSIYIDDQYYYSIVDTDGENSTPLVELLSGFNEDYEIIGGIDSGNKIVTHKYRDLNEASNLYPIQIWDLNSGQLEKEISPDIATDQTGANMIPEVHLCGDNCVFSLTRNGYVYRTNLTTGNTIEYDISDLNLTTEDTTYLQYNQEDDIIYLITQPLNENEYLEIYDISNNKLILKAKVNRYDQFFSGFEVNNKAINP